MITTTPARTTENTMSELLDFDDPTNNAPQRMALARKNLGLSQTDLGNLITPPAKQTVVHRWEAGDNKPTYPRRIQIAQILGLHLPGQEIIGRTTEPIITNITTITDPITHAENRILQAQDALNHALRALAEARTNK